VEQWGWVNASAGVAVASGIPDVLDSPQYTYTAAAPGPQVFNLAGREDGLYLDVYVLSLDADLSVAELNALASVPEPTSSLFLTGLALVATFRRRRSR
jgi:hypothetical protein